VVSLSSLFGDDADILHETNFQALFLANILGPLGLGLLSPVLDSLIDPFGTSAANIGLLMSAYTAPAIVLIPLAGLLADLIGRKPMLIGGILLLGPTGAAISLTTDFRIAIGLRLLQGIGAAAIVPIIIASLGDLYEGTREATAQGLRFTSSGLTQVVFPLIAGVLVGLSWRFPFLLYLVALPIAGVVYAWFDEPGTDNDEEGPDSIGETLRSLRELLAFRHVQAVVFVRGLPGMLWIGFLTYNSIIVVQFLNRDPVQAGLLAALGSLSFALAASQAGRITALFSSRLYPLLAANLALGVGFAVVVLAPTLPLAMIGTVSLGCGFGITLSIYRSLITGMAPPALRGSIVSVAESFGRLTITATPAVMGLAIGALSPRLGFQTALQTVGVATAAIAAIGGIGGLLVVNATSPPYSEE
jgi:MFS family permease